MASRRLTKSAFAAVKSSSSSRASKHSLYHYQSPNSLLLSRARSSVSASSSSSSPFDNSSASRFFNGVSSGGNAASVSFTRCFNSSSRGFSTATSSSQANPSEYTEMAWEEIVGAVDAAQGSKQQMVETEHLMKALLEQKDGLARRIFTKAGVDNTSVLQETDSFISQQPKIPRENMRHWTNMEMT